MYSFASAISFLGQFAERRVRVAIQVLQYATSKGIQLSAALLKLAEEVWCWCGQKSPADYTAPPSSNIIHDGPAAGNARSIVPDNIVETGATTGNDDESSTSKEIVRSVLSTVLEDVLEKATSNGEGTEEEEEVVPVFSVEKKKKGKKGKKGGSHNGVVRSSRKKGIKSRAAYNLRGVNGAVVPPQP